jgi:transcription elongation factor GreA
VAARGSAGSAGPLTARQSARRREASVSKVHLTKRGYEALQEELRRLKVRERVKVAEDIRVARAHGDLSENAEYHAAKEKQGHIEARIRMLEDKLARAEVVDTQTLSTDRVRFGTTVVLENLDSGEEVVYTLIGEDEADISRGLLSITSPIGRALIGKAVDDEVRIQVPSGTRMFEVRAIRRMNEAEAEG